ncbi:MAG: hypothetical protein IJR47_01670 [Clostridia bacterium]|nr:hypothetical protein [Clostridia bacterium]
MLEYRQLGNTALKPEIEYEEYYNNYASPDYVYKKKYEHKKPVQKQKQVSRGSEISTGMKVKVVFRIFLVTVLALVMVAKYASVSVANIEMEAMKQTISEQRIKNDNLESILTGTMQLDSIQDKATALEMSFPSSDQIVYLQVTPFSTLVEQNRMSEQNEKKMVFSQVSE